MSLDMTSFSAALKTLYTPAKIENMVYADHPLLAFMPKMEAFKGDSMAIPIRYGDSQNGSADFATAAAGTTNAKITKFLITRNHDYHVASVDNETMMASEGDAGAFLRAATVAIDSAISATTQSLATSLYRSGSGSIGQVSNASFATTGLTLVNADDVGNFAVGMKLQVAAADGGGSVRTGDLTVTNVNRDTGVVTTSANLSTGISAIATNDYIVRKGDYDLKVKGLQAWVPNDAPSSTSFFGVDRSVDTTRLGGVRYDGSAMPIEEALIGAATRVAREGGNPNYCFLHYTKFAELVKALGARVNYVTTNATATIGFQTIEIQGPRGKIKVIADGDCPSDRAFLLQLDTWKLYSLGKAPMIINGDGLEMLRDSSSDSFTLRVAYYAQLACNAPGFNANVKLS